MPKPKARRTPAKGAASKNKKATPTKTGKASPKPMTRGASDAETASAPHPPPTPLPVPIVGIGASAGGLEALEVFLRTVPERCGMAFVVVQHLDPTRKDRLVEILQRATRMPVAAARDGAPVQPDHVYVIPPNHDLEVLHGALHLSPASASRGVKLPIDHFFRTLADDQGPRAIAVVLSGMGSDGTLGVRAVKEAGGLVLVQSRASAKFDGMPNSVIEAGLADVVAPAEELPERIASYLRHHAPFLRPSAAPEEHQRTLDKLFLILRTHTGNDFSFYKRSTIERRIERRMSLHQLRGMTEYLRFVRENPREVELLFKELLIGVTSFFRDPDAWEQMKTEVLPPLLASRPEGTTLRAWVPGCSTGEEAYSLAIVLSEALEQLSPPKRLNIQIFATDLDHDAIEQARQGLYLANIAADVSPERLRRFFHQEEQRYRIRKELRERVVFAPQNVIHDPPFTRLDLLSCRNLLIYLSADVQKKLIPLFHYSLNPGGLLLLGSAETVGASGASVFKHIDGRARVYQRLETTMGLPAVEFPSSFNLTTRPLERTDAPEPVEPVRHEPPNLQALTDRVIVQRFCPLAMLANDKGDLIYSSARSGKYLEPSVGRANLNIFSMAKEGLRYELSSVFSAALRQDLPVVSRGLKLSLDGQAHYVDLSALKLSEPKELRGTVLVALTEVSPPVKTEPLRAKGDKKQVELLELLAELQRARGEAQTAREEMQTSQEELRAMNEELQSTNEELQSTNEELTTSKEEMQSMNEELQTVNHELQAKLDDLSRSTNDMKNLLNSTEVATLFLDGELRVRRFTTPTAKLIRLIPGDAGRPITDITTALDYPDLAEDAREVLRTLVFKEKLAAGRDGHWYTVRILPYRTLENVIDGVVITFTDSTSAKRLEATLREQAEELRRMTEALPHLGFRCRPDGTCDYVSAQWSDYTGAPESEAFGFGWLDQVHPSDREATAARWTAVVAAGAPLNTELRLKGRAGSYRWFKTRCVPVRNDRGEVLSWYGTHTDIHDLKTEAQARRDAAEALDNVLRSTSDAVLLVDEHLVITHANAPAARLLGRPGEELVGAPLADALPAVAEHKLRDGMRRGKEARVNVVLGEPPATIVCDLELRPFSRGASVVLHEHHSRDR